MREKHLLILILLAFTLLGIVYALTTPPFEASDELWHYPMVRHLADGNPLPVQDPQNVGPWKQEASQPPLYYYLGAALTFWIDTGDMPQVRWLNPHVDNGVITADGNINLAVHDPAASRWQGALLAVTVVRLASVLLGLATVVLTYHLARAAAPHRPEIALGAAALNAFTPMFLFISGAVNNDNLALPLTALGVWLMMWAVRRARQDQPVKGRDWLLLGIVVGAAALTKEGTLALLPLAGGTLFLVEWQAAAEPATLPAFTRVLGRSLRRFLWVLMPAFLIAGWWYIRNLQLYGDWLGWNAFLAVLGQRAHPASLAQLWDERWGFLLSYWGLFGGVNVPMPTWIYRVLNGILIVGLIGFIPFVAQRLRAFWNRPRHQSRNVVAGILRLSIDEFPLLICLLLSAAVIYGVIQWATVTWSSQGRLVFTAISALNVLLALGLAGWLPPRPARTLLTVIVGFFFLVAAAAPFLWIRPAYTHVYANEDASLPHPLDLHFGGQMRLLGYDVDKTTLFPGDQVEVRLLWQGEQPMTRAWSVFVHLNDPVLGVPIAQRDMYPGQGLVATSLLPPGQRLLDRYILQVPPTAIAPADLSLTVGLYDYDTGERLLLADGTDTAALATLMLQPRPGSIPNALNVNFGNEFTLRGYEVTPRRARAGESLMMHLYWQADAPPSRDYTFFVQVLGAENRRWAAADIAPTPDTSHWSVDELQTVTFPLTLDPDTPAQVFPIIAGIYWQDPDGNFHRLQTVTPTGRLTDDFLELTQIRILP